MPRKQPMPRRSEEKISDEILKLTARMEALPETDERRRKLELQIGDLYLEIAAINDGERL